MIPLRGRGHVATSIFAVLAGRSPAQARSRCLENTEEDVGGAVVRSEPRRMTRPQVAYFLSGVLVYFPSGARRVRAEARFGRACGNNSWIPPLAS